MLARDGSESQSALLVQLAQSNPVLLVLRLLSQGRNLCAVDFGEPGRLLRNGGGVLLKHVHDKVCQAGNVLLVLLVLELALVVDVGQEV